MCGIAGYWRAPGCDGSREGLAAALQQMRSVALMTEGARYAQRRGASSDWATLVYR